MNRVFVATAALSTALVLGLSACQQTTPPPPPPPDTSEFDQGEVIEEEVIEEVVVEIDLGTIYFDFDKSNIREDARGVLRGNAEALIATGAVQEGPIGSVGGFGRQAAGCAYEVEAPVGAGLVLSSAERGTRGRATTPLELRILVSRRLAGTCGPPL